VGTLIQDQQQRNPEGQPRWDRFERADLFEQYRELRTQGFSERQAAKELKVPRSTLQAWRVWHDTLDICPHVAEFFQGGPGLAFLHRLVIAFHMVCVEVGACGIRLVCLFLNLTGLNRFVAASYGAQQQVNVQIEQAMVAYDQDETARLAPGMPQKDLTVTQDETFTGGLCLITMDPDSNFIILEQPAPARDQTSWNEHMAPALAQFNCRVIQSTSDEAPGLLAYVEHYLEAHHSPDLFHMQHELVNSKTTPYTCNGLKIMTKPGMYEGQPHQSLPPWHLSPIYGAVRHGQGHLFAFVRHALVSRYARHVEESSPAHAVLARGHACLVSWA
jgi:hypothetical protein